MIETGQIIPEDMKQIWMERIWLDYYNRVLLNREVITPQEFNKMATLIQRRCIRQLRRRGLPTQHPFELRHRMRKDAL